MGLHSNFAKNIISMMSIATLASAANAASPTIYEAEDVKGADVVQVTDANKVYELNMTDVWQVYDTTKTISISGNKYAKSEGSFEFPFTIEQTAVYDFSIHMWIETMYVSNNMTVSVDGKEVATYGTKTEKYTNKEFTLNGSVKLKPGEHTIKIAVGTNSGFDFMSLEVHPDPEFNISALPVTPGATESAMKVKTFLRDNFMKKTISGMMISDQNFNYHYGDTTETGAAVPEENWLIQPGKCTPADSCKFSDEEVSWKGQTDIAEFYKRSGHYPAIGGFDMLFAAGGNHDKGWFLGYTENNLVMTEELWKMGGIPTYTWHWKVGQDTIFYTQGTPAGFNNSGCTEGVTSTAANNTCFNYTKAFKGEQCSEIDETSQEYKDIVADVDIVSGYFKQLEEKDIAVLWRPLHEASGGWFWWGVGSPECYVQLWRLVFNRMVNVNKNKNLIWVWNINTDPEIGYDYTALNGAWYPGDEYVDIVAVDIYDQLNNHNSAANYWNKIIEEVGTNKMIALSENGAIPDIDSIAEDKSYWSYWMTWSQTWSGNFLEKTPADMWKRNLEDERIIALDNMPGWDKVIADKSTEGAVIAPSEGMVVTAPRISADNITLSMQGKALSMYIPQAGRGSIAVFDMMGHRIATLAQGNMTAGTHRFDMQSIANGSYIVRATVGSSNATKVIKLK